MFDGAQIIEKVLLSGLIVDYSFQLDCEQQHQKIPDGRTVECELAYVGALHDMATPYLLWVALAAMLLKQFPSYEEPHSTQFVHINTSQVEFCKQILASSRYC